MGFFFVDKGSFYFIDAGLYSPNKRTQLYFSQNYLYKNCLQLQGYEKYKKSFPHSYPKKQTLHIL